MATNYFLDHAEDAAHKEGLHTEVARLRGPKFDVSKGDSHSRKTNSTEIEHVVPVIDGFIVDWTMRQFNPDADFPHVEEEYSYKSKWNGEGGEWA